MSLSDRLRKARTEQLRQAGVLARTDDDRDESELVLDLTEPVPPADDSSVETARFEPITIEAQPVGLHLVAPGATVTEVADDGFTVDENRASCPTCNAHAVADMVDLVGHTVHYTCATCSTMWQVRKDAVSEFVVP